MLVDSKLYKIMKEKTEEYFDPLKRKKPIRCEKHNIMIAGGECPLCKLEKKFSYVRDVSKKRSRKKFCKICGKEIMDRKGNYQKCLDCTNK
jgi:hypothetical protein